MKNFHFIKKFFSGVKFSSDAITMIKQLNFNLNNCFIKPINKLLFLIYKNNFFSLLLKKKEVFFLNFFLKKKFYKIIPTELIRINSLFKIIIYLSKFKKM
ncbi:putative tmRNA-binding protein [Candidatus Carsonella ruddii]|uniref:Putative tmRNA-binding protein n=1 Tax=Candidatus Carsonella ruddii CE isolate Thao2000 TaxID=1202536 RepID=J7GS47_CARRU|nr:putative tmRNA-binding protein [Candidatus Carsonella ruddii]AFP83547.1 putative tmRNA-binding protein [Candidatus Carsonella ruddii CE isolate Thao2000]